MAYSPDDTIVAIATPRGRGGIGVVRLSGPESEHITRFLCGRAETFEPRRATVARIIDAAHDDHIRAVDEVVVTSFIEPHSYTGEDVVEISAHGSPMLLDRIVALAIERGARLAEPGEFTLRAYVHERLDLIQAEAVADLIDAVTPLQARAAMDQLEGTLTGAITAIESSVFELAARLEASLDFPDEGFRFIDRDGTRDSLSALRQMIDALVARGRSGRILREGRTVVLAGRPNTGKSSLFNALAGADRAIVTNVPGTTRDLLTEHLDISGVPVTLVDTAGIREALDAIEAEGVSRAEHARAIAELILVVLDGSEPLTDDDRRVLDETREHARVVVINKSDLPAAWSTDSLGDAKSARIVHASARTGAGLDALRQTIAGDVVDALVERDAPAVTNARHLALLESAAASIAGALGALDAGATEEMLLVELADARAALEDVRGRRAPDELLHQIFSKFCIGK